MPHIDFLYVSLLAVDSRMCRQICTHIRILSAEYAQQQTERYPSRMAPQSVRTTSVLYCIQCPHNPSLSMAIYLHWR